MEIKDEDTVSAVVIAIVAIIINSCRALLQSIHRIMLRIMMRRE
jgi:hypothetical protein